MSRHSRTTPNQHDRRDRHAAFTLLLPRLEKGVLTREEAALLAAYVREEVRLGEKTRRSLNRCNRKLAAHREAADAEIRALETKLAAIRTRDVAEAWRAAVSEAIGLGNGAPWDAIRDRAAELHDEQVRIRAGEEAGWDPTTVPTPGQWIARWNRASAEERLNVARRVIEDAARAAGCFEKAHEERLQELGRRLAEAGERFRDLVGQHQQDRERAAERSAVQ